MLELHDRQSLMNRRPVLLGNSFKLSIEVEQNEWRDVSHNNVLESNPFTLVKFVSDGLFKTCLQWLKCSCWSFCQASLVSEVSTNIVLIQTLGYSNYAEYY